MNCTRCEGTGFLNAFAIPETIAQYLGDLNHGAIALWIADHPGTDVEVCDCCGNGVTWYGEPGTHNSRDNGRSGVYAYNGGLPECN